MKASIVDLRYRMKDVLKAVDRGETVTVLYRGKEKAQLVPIVAAKKNALRSDPAFGMWAERKELKHPGQWLRNLRQGRRFDI